jgi:hypothetical protein
MDIKIKRLFIGGSNNGTWDEENESAEIGYRNHYGEIYRPDSEIQTRIGKIRIYVHYELSFEESAKLKTEFIAALES